MNRVDDADAASGKAPVDCLRVLQVRIHPRGSIQKPRAQMTRSLFCVARILGNSPRCGQGRHLHAQTHQRAAMLVEVVRVRHAITLDIWPAWILWIRPPVITLGKKVVPAAGAARTMRSRDRDRGFVQILVCCFQDSLTIEPGDVESWLLC